MTKITLEVEGMSCGHCKNAVEGALIDLKGVTSAEVDLEGDKVTVNYDESKVEKDDFKEAIEEAGPYKMV